MLQDSYTAEQRRVCKEHGILLIPHDEFVTELRSSATRCKEALGDDSYESMMFLDGKINSWTGGLVQDILTVPPRQHGIPREWGASHNVVFIDDACYSGHQMEQLIHFYIGMGWHPNLTVHIVVPFVSDQAHGRISNQFDGRVKEIKWYRSSMPLPDPIPREHTIPSFKVSERFAFDHTFPDGISVVWPDLKVPRPTFKHVYRKNVT